MYNYQKVKDLPPQFTEIFAFHQELETRTGKIISLSEAIAHWIALGYAEDFRNKMLFADS